MKEGTSVNHTKMRKECEVLWAKNKYYVLSKSHKVYLEIREYLKEKEVDILLIKEKILNLRNVEESKKDATDAEKQGLFSILDKYMTEQSDQEAVIEYIKALLKKYPNQYLQESTLLTGEYDEIVA